MEANTNRTRRVRTSALLMCSMAFTVVTLVFTSTASVRALNCCQTCESLDATCPAACEDQCDGNPSCLDTCYSECEARSDACWGIQGQGPYCEYCSYGGCTYTWWWVETPSGHIIDSWCS